MSSEAALFLILGAAAGGFINGLAGTGTALFALGFYLVALEPVPAVAIVALMSVISGLQGLWVVRSQLRPNRERILRYALPGLVGVPLGLMLLRHMDASSLRIGIGAMLVVYGGYFAARRSLPAFTRQTPTLDGAIGLIGGILGGLASLAGAIPSMWMSLRPWTKAEMRATLQSFNMAILGLTVVLLVARNAYNKDTLIALSITVPVGLIAAQVGLAVFRQLSDSAFRRLLIVLTLLVGIGILASELS